MTFTEITQLLSQGLTPDQILTLAQTPAPAPTPEPAPAPTPAPAPASDMTDVLARLDKLTEAVQAGAVYMAMQKPPEDKTPSAEDVMRSLVFPKGTNPDDNK